MEDKEYSLKFTTRAEEDLDEIYDYIADNLFAPETAESLIDKFENKILRLKTFPYYCSYVLDETLKNVDIESW